MEIMMNLRLFDTPLNTTTSAGMTAETPST